MNFCEVSKKDFKEWLEMGFALWPHYKKKGDELKTILESIIKSRKQTAFLCKNNDNKPIAFINISLRSDYVQGSKTSPVGYIEGIFVKPKYRNQGIAKELIKIAEKWTMKKGCKELGSDAELDNTDSQKFHKKLGFKEANKIVSFIKTINSES